MKLSDLSTDRALDVLCELTPYIANITNDEELVRTLGRKMDNSAETNLYGQFALLAGRIGEITPLLLKSHRTDVYGILSILNEKPAAEIAAQPVTETMRQVLEVFQDTELIRFFRSSVRREQTGSSAPSADSHASV